MTRQEERVAKVKLELIDMLASNPAIGAVGRVHDWLHDPDSRYPVSCTQLAVQDKMEGEEGIEYSWAYTSKNLRYAAGVALDLSQLRPKDTDNGKGLTASGPASFTPIYSSLNGVLRRGGKFKNGAVVVYLDASHPDLLDFLALKPSDIPWAKKALYVSDVPTDPDYILNNPHLEAILDAVRYGTLWLAKKRWYNPATNETVNYDTGHRLYSNVCLEILIPSRATCTLSHVNLGQVSIKTLRKAFRDTMRFLCKLHGITGAGKDNYYLPTKVDRQVGMGVFGLANLLAKYKISYATFSDALGEYMDYVEAGHVDLEFAGTELRKTYPHTAVLLVETLYLAYQDAAEIARQHNMQRAFTIAPTATCSFRHTDSDGYTTAPEISPPSCHPVTKKLTRDSSTFGTVEYQYPPKVHSAEEVGWVVYYSLAKSWQRLMNSTGLAHSMSVNIWNECPVDREWFEDWLSSPLVTTYYRFLVDQGFVDKTHIETGISNNLIDETEGFFVPDEDGPEENNSNYSQMDFLAEFASKQCNIYDRNPSDDICTACSE